MFMKQSSFHVTKRKKATRSKRGSFARVYIMFILVSLRVWQLAIQYCKQINNMDYTLPVPVSSIICTRLSMFRHR